MDDASAAAFGPVFLEPRDDYWEMHAPEHVSMDDQRAYHLVPRATADQLPNLVHCEDCFPAAAGGEGG